MKAPGGSVRPDIGAARAQGVNEGPLYGLCPPGWPASTLFTPALRSDIARARQVNLRLRAGLIYPLFNSLLESVHPWRSGSELNRQANRCPEHEPCDVNVVGIGV